MAPATMTLSFNPGFSPLLPPSYSNLASRVRGRGVGFVTLQPFCNPNLLLNLSSSHNFSGFRSFLPQRLCTISNTNNRRQSLQSLAIFATKGYKMKTHKASAKRFRVTGNGKIMRRRAGKQHLLKKKSRKRKLRLSKIHPVSRSDYNNIVGALPYLKVNREAT